jgi:hypothetical protein
MIAVTKLRVSHAPVSTSLDTNDTERWTSVSAIRRRCSGRKERYEVGSRNGSTWLPPVEVSPAGLTSHQPQVALDPRGGATVVWLVSEASVHRQTDTTTRPAGTGCPRPTRRHPCCLDPLVRCAHQQPPPSRVHPGGREHRDRGFLSGDGQDVNDPRVAFDRNGNALVIWAGSDGANRRVQVAFRPAGGSFGPPHVVALQA